MPSLLAFGALSVAHHVTQMSAELRVCRVCKQTYTAATNGPRACRYHSGRWMGAENSKHYGGGPASASTPYPRGVSHFWDCCDGENIDSPGCCYGWHKSYDDE